MMKTVEAIDRDDGQIDRLLPVAHPNRVSDHAFLWRQRWMNQKRDRNFFASIFSASRSDLKILNRVERINLAFVFISGINL